MNIFKKRISLILSMVMLALVILPIFAVNASTTIDASIKIGSKTLNDGDSITVEGGEDIKLTLSSTEVGILKWGYYFDGEAVKEYSISSTNTYTVTLTVPTGTPGSTRVLKVAAAGRDGEGTEVRSSWYKFTLNYPKETIDDKEINLKYNSKTLADKSTTTVYVGDTVQMVATPKSEVEKLYYNWDGQKNGWMEISNVSLYDLELPSSFVAGSTHYLYLKARFSDGELTEQKNYKLNVVDNEPQVSMVVTLDSKTMKEDGTYTVKGGETIKAVAKSTVSDIAFIGYRYVVDGVKTDIKDVNGDTLTLTLPTGTPGSKREIRIEAVAANDDGSANTITKTGWISFFFEYAQDQVIVDEPAIDTTYNGKVLTNGSTTTANPGESVKISATPTDNVTKISFKWDNDPWSVANAQSTYTTRIPTTFAPGSTHWLYVKADYADGKTIEKAYKFTIPASASQITMNVKLDSQTILAGNTYNVEGGEEVKIAASSTGSSVSYIEYHFGSNAVTRINASSASVKVPTGSVGSSIKLYVTAIATDGTTTGEKVYTLKYIDNSSVDKKLDVEPWMEENDELEQLSISLRNDSEEEDKANKNIYALNEVVTYYIDYKNGSSKDITSEVKIELKLPLNYTVVSKDGGTVKDDTITWTYKNGLKEGEADTLVVKVKYTGFTKSKYDSETIYPTARILQANKEKDISAVINFIITDYDEKIDVEHEPYMLGDADADTFRPNDSITRAEGALVLARIYGLNYEKTPITNVFSDLDETYEMAQRAIIASTKAGLISGYTDGTYRPNDKMTKAEFMTILARMVENYGEDEEIDGLEIKEVDELIKIYDDSTRYYIVDGKKVYSHWALEEVSLLARLNMTPLSEDDDEIELDEEITRAEVAQLVNFYLLRAPANVTSKTDSGFSDVTKKHKLFADIIEATRDEHIFMIDSEDGTEIAK